MKKLRVTVDGKVFDVVVEMLDEHPAPVYPSAWVPHAQPPPTPPPSPSTQPPRSPVASVPASPGANSVLSPLAGKVVAIDVKVGMEVTEGAQLVTLEAMKMNTFVYAPKSGTVAAIHVNPGDAVEEGAPLLTVV